MLSRLSYIVPLSIIIVSKRAKKIYEKKGYDIKKLKYIPNGYNLSTLKINKVKKIFFIKKIILKKNTTNWLCCSIRSSERSFKFTKCTINN